MVINHCCVFQCSLLLQNVYGRRSTIGSSAEYEWRCCTHFGIATKCMYIYIYMRVWVCVWLCFYLCVCVCVFVTVKEVDGYSRQRDRELYKEKEMYACTCAKQAVAHSLYLCGINVYIYIYGIRAN